MTSDDTPSLDQLLAVLRATEAGLAELDQILTRLEDYETELMTHEFVAGQHARQTRKTAAMIEALEQATAGQVGPLAAKVAGILRDR
ncbi:hypothetical protein F8M49_01030 [Rhodococcus zopfii]|uniref:Uncharacterized protein n=1 Tax=Rhodococcus zopfii TaxID=43772 RepID=A0ABU3WK37_9NOCA|nr:hypothetical protein [Rhodococcus zopfii]